MLFLLALIFLASSAGNLDAGNFGHAIYQGAIGLALLGYVGHKSNKKNI